MSGAASLARIGAYTLLRHIETANGVDVHLAQQVGPLGFVRLCEVKVLAVGQASVATARDLAREASICARLNHPTIIHVFDFFEHEGRLVLVTEHVDGVTLEQLMQHARAEGRQLDERAIVYLAHQVFGALSAAHGAVDDEGRPSPVVHRNVHPGNVIISWDGDVHLAGFGLARILEPAGDARVSALAFAANYMAPEQGRGDRLTPKTDLYSAALVLWSLLTGREPPLTGARPEEISRFGLSIPREIAAAVDASLEPNPDRRTLDCRQVTRWLEKAAEIESGRPALVRELLPFKAAAEPMPRLTPVDDPTDSTWMQPGPKRPSLPVTVPGASTAPRISGVLRENRAVRVALGAALVGALIGGGISWAAAGSKPPVATLQAISAGASRETVAQVVVANAAAATPPKSAPATARGSKPSTAARDQAPAPAPHAPTASPAAKAAPPPPRASTFGHITVASKVVGQVFVNGTLYGPVNKRLEVPCGAWFMRIGIAEHDGTPHHFLGEGRTVVVECGAKNQLVRNLGPAPKDTAAKPTGRRATQTAARQRPTPQ